MNENDQKRNGGAAQPPAPDKKETQAAEIGRKLRELEEREQALCLREREERCRAALKERALPQMLVRCLDLTSDERAEKTLDALEEVFQAAVTATVRERLGAEPPRAKGAEIDPMAAVRRAMGLG